MQGLNLWLSLLKLKAHHQCLRKEKSNIKFAKKQDIASAKLIPRLYFVSCAWAKTDKMKRKNNIVKMKLFLKLNINKPHCKQRLE